jgi:hypothetical protein
MFKRILVIGWVLLFLGASLVLLFPNASWGRAASWMLWVISIALALSTLGFFVFLAIRFGFRLSKRPVCLPVNEAQPLKTNSGSSWPRTLRLSLLVLFGGAAFVASLLAFIEWRVKSSPVYQTSVADAHASPAVLKILGQPINEGWFVSGQVTEFSDGGGRATLAIPLDGPKGNGTLRVEATRQAGNWRFSILQFASPRNSTVDILHEQPGEP